MCLIECSGVETTFECYLAKPPTTLKMPGCVACVVSERFNSHNELHWVLYIDVGRVKVMSWNYHTLVYIDPRAAAHFWTTTRYLKRGSLHQLKLLIYRPLKDGGWVGPEGTSTPNFWQSAERPRCLKFNQLNAHCQDRTHNPGRRDGLCYKQLPVTQVRYRLS